MRITNNDVMNVIGRRWDRERANSDVMSCEEGGLRLRVSVVPTHLIAVRLLLDIGKKIPTSSFELE